MGEGGSTGYLISSTSWWAALRKKPLDRGGRKGPPKVVGVFPLIPPLILSYPFPPSSSMNHAQQPSKSYRSTPSYYTYPLCPCLNPSLLSSLGRPPRLPGHRPDRKPLQRSSRPPAPPTKRRPPWNPPALPPSPPCSFQRPTPPVPHDTLRSWWRPVQLPRSSSPRPPTSL